MGIISDIINFIALSIIIIGALIAISTLIQTIISCINFVIIPDKCSGREIWNSYKNLLPKITIIVPCYNEEQTIATSLGALLSVEYPDFEIIVVNDGSKDKTIDALIANFNLIELEFFSQGKLKHKPINRAFRSTDYPNLFVFDKKNGGKADALNLGCNMANGEFVCTIDADSILSRDALLQAARIIISSKDDVVAVGGAIRLTNGCMISQNNIEQVAIPKNILALFQCVEYLRTFHIARNALSAVSALNLVSGAFGLFCKETIYAIGGYNSNTVGEDYELCVKINEFYLKSGQKNKKIKYCPDAICWTQVPEEFNILERQRTRWQRGAMETLWRYKFMIGNKKYGRISWFSLVESLLSDIITPVTEVAGYLIIPICAALNILSIDYLIAFLTLSIGFGIVQSTAAIFLEELRFRLFPKHTHIITLLLAAIIENFGYRQICSYFRIKGFWQYFHGNHNWGDMKRKSFA